MKANIFLLMLALLASSLLLGRSSNVDKEFVDTGDETQILVIGDSIFATNSKEDAAIHDFVGESLGVQVINRSLAGAYVTDDYDTNYQPLEIPNQYANGDWDWIIMNGGANDLNDDCGCGECERTFDDIVSADGTAGTLPEFIADRTAEGTRVIFLDYYEMPTTALFGFEHCHDAMDAYADRLQMMDAANDSLWYVSAKDAVNAEELGLFHSDHVHPSPEGSKAIGELLASKINEIEQIDRMAKVDSIISLLASE